MRTNLDDKTEDFKAGYMFGYADSSSDTLDVIKKIKRELEGKGHEFASARGKRDGEHTAGNDGQ